MILKSNCLLRVLKSAVGNRNAKYRDVILVHGAIDPQNDSALLL